MITFDNLLFLDHPHNKGAIMTQIRGLKSKGAKRISIVCGEGMYSSSRAGNRAECQRIEDASSFEVLVDGEDDVRGWQSREDINKILAENF
ncbi:hypothetical protein N9H35_00225 [bacterium]|nr:hypothetical protein [bacterium]